MQQSASSSQVAMDDLLSEDEFPWKHEEFSDHDSAPPCRSSPKPSNRFMMWEEDTVDDFNIMWEGRSRQDELCSAALAVKFANSGHPTLVVSNDPAHSLSDSFAQDLTGGQLVSVERPDYLLFTLEKRLGKSCSVTRKNGGTGMKDLMDGMGLGMLIEQELSEEEKQVWNMKAAEAMEAYKKELEEYNNSIAAATDDKQQPHKELVEEEEHTTTNTFARMPNQRRISLSVSMNVEYV
ncbi:hypothetical protein Dsin_014471 [Dipteronia sinensis]|uniref:ArsA/GET3 Anion-transporting ATPase-like domain-containing protein n=1 Tax=Dipteronia sinensis TaxID=43782 RepID=A0AAE0AM19_9ROSI|nr:hypothetical protein Dsin_014471 [Dipteronia sinensis]